MSEPIVLVGCGKMGGAMLSGWIESDFLNDGIFVVEPNTDAIKDFQEVSNIKTVSYSSEIPKSVKPAVIVLAVKPQTMDEAVPALERFVEGGAAFLSVAAGKTLGYFEAQLGSKVAAVRAMPNTPAAVGRGITVYVANNNVSEKKVKLCGDLLSAVGEALLIEDEALLDPVTAVSGSGPAYVFFLIEAMAAAGVKVGLPDELAMRLARATVSGAGELARLSQDSASQLRINVTSPGGTTAAALEVLMSNEGIQPVFDKAIEAASLRSRELAG